MPIDFACTNCAKQVRVPDGSEGKKCKCPECQTILNVPEIKIESFEIKLEVPCPRCAFVLLCDPNLEGTRGLCPNCQLIFTITPTGNSKNTEPVSSMQATFAFQCPHCKQLFEGKPGMEGRKGKCIHCKEVFEIKKFAEPVIEVQATSIDNVPRPLVSKPTLPNPIKSATRQASATQAPAAPTKPQVPVAKPITPTIANDWLGALPPSGAYPTSNSSSPINPYAASANPSTFAVQPGQAISGTPESIRRFYLSHESAIKGFGLLYGFSSGCYILIAIAAAVLSVVAFAAEGGIAPGIFVLIYAAVYFVIGALTALVCSGLYKLSDVGKIGGSIFAVLGLCAIPLGTILGGYLLFLLFSEKGNFIFSQNYRAIVKQTPHIRCFVPVFIWILLALFVLLSLFLVFVLLFGARA